MDEAGTKRIKDSFERQTFLSLIGAKLESVEPGSVAISCQRRDCLTQQHGMLHAGVISTLADVACGYAALTTIPEGWDVMSVEYKINLMRPAAGDAFIATGKVLKSGRTLVITEAEVRESGSGKLIAKMLGTMIPAKASE